MEKHKHISSNISNQVYYCSECKLYWFKVNEKEIEFRLYIFAPINVEKCPFCKGTNKSPITQRLKDFIKVAKGEMSIEHYHKIYGVDNSNGI